MRLVVHLQTFNLLVMNNEKFSFWLKLLIAVLSAISGAIGGAAVVAAGVVVP